MSLAWQSLPANEIVVVHDGPLTEELYYVLNKWRSILPLNEVILPKNVGLGDALNAGLASCKHEYIIRVDTDDVNHSNRFEKQIHYMCTAKDIAVSSAYIYEFENDYQNPCRIKRVPAGHEIKNYSLRRNPLNHMAVIFKKSAVIDVGGYHHLPYMEDYYLWLRLIARGYNISNMNEALVSARIGNGMLERRRGITYVKSEAFMLKKIYELKLSNNILPFIYYSLRIISRLIPKNIFHNVYSTLRKY
ncbi:glycosyltransferase [Vibrio mimicus]|nr:glycosyltransferase [Vibrio mimicus]MBY7675984.1 glycosyltransferase [Vibrio mimicus]